MSRDATILRLRDEIRRVHAGPRQYLLSLHTGLDAIDALGVWRLGGCVELCGDAASGRTSLALTAVGAAGREGRLCAWVDGPKELYPPAALGFGVPLSQLLVVRPRAPGQLVWSAVQLLRSGAFTCVVLDLERTGVRPSLTDAKKLADAARAGGALLLLLTARERPAEGFVRLVLQTPPVLRLAETEDLLEIDAPHGRHITVPRAQLFAGAAPRLRRCPHVEATPDEPVAFEPFVRRKKNLQREGFQPPNRPVGEAAPTYGCGIRNGRPGRDAPEAPFRELLGVPQR